MNKYTCQRPIHPGEILKEEIEYRGITQNDFAVKIGMSYKQLNDTLNQRRPLTPATAMLFEAALGVNADMLMRIQLDYNMRTVRENKTFMQRIESIRKAVAVF